MNSLVTKGAQPADLEGLRVIRVVSMEAPGGRRSPTGGAGRGFGDLARRQRLPDRVVRATLRGRGLLPTAKPVFSGCRRAGLSQLVEVGAVVSPMVRAGSFEVLLPVASRGRIVLGEVFPLIGSYAG
jgi:hypothetical protein